MKKLILTCAILCAFESQAANKNPWTLPKSELLHVYECIESEQNTELLRLYADGTYEHLLYLQKNSRREQVERNLGKYVIARGKIEFLKPTQNEFTGKFKFGIFQFKDGKIFSNVVDAVFRTSLEAFKRTDDQRYRKPFFMKLKKDEVVNNSGASNLLNLKDLVNYLLKGKKTESEKLYALETFIARSVSFDEMGLKTGKTANEQINTLAILAGTERTAICSGYALTLFSLCREAGLNCRKVDGLSRTTSARDALLPHSWNIISVDGKAQLHDLTWADEGDELDAKWIDVLPEVFVNSHYPQKTDDQLLSSPLSREEFQSRPLISGKTKLESLPVTNLKKENFFKDRLEFSIDGDHSVQVLQLPAALLNEVYRGERPKITFTPKPMDIEVSTKDGKTMVNVSLSDHLYLIRIVIDGVIETEVKALKNGPEALFHHYMAVATNKFADPYVRGVLSALKMKDMEKLKALVGDTNMVFFNEKKKLILDPDVLAKIATWRGEVSGLTKQISLMEFFDEEGNVVEEEKEEFYIETSGKLRLFVVKEETTFRIDRIELSK